MVIMQRYDPTLESWHSLGIPAFSKSHLMPYALRLKPLSYALCLMPYVSGLCLMLVAVLLMPRSIYIEVVMELYIFHRTS